MSMAKVSICDDYGGTAIISMPSNIHMPRTCAVSCRPPSFIKAGIASSSYHLTIMVFTASHSPIYYVGQPTVMRDPSSAAWIKSSPVIVSRVHTAPARPAHNSTQTMESVQYKRNSPPPSRSSMSPSPPPSDVPTAVSTLLGLTKQLQDVLRLWSTIEASEAQVSDAFVLVGMQFNATVNAFSRHHIDMR